MITQQPWLQGWSWPKLPVALLAVPVWVGKLARATSSHHAPFTPSDSSESLRWGSHPQPLLGQQEGTEKGPLSCSGEGPE